ncbi:MAG: hypothetical protein QF752_03400 [Planctomycetota bacterium]|jgi:hypothetical protein|nr:hypothetical protein [Planctomycetota bacterium]
MNTPFEPIEPADLTGVRTYSIQKRRNLVDSSAFASRVGPEDSIGQFLDSLPDILAGKSLRELCQVVARAHAGGRSVGIAIGGHVVKCGLGPLLIDLMERGVIDGILMHGATAIHDTEIARLGQTSEDVGATLKEGRFGMAEETASFFSQAYTRAVEEGRGLGHALGQSLLDEKAPNADCSLLAACARLGRPAMVVVAVGTDIVHMHPGFDAGALGQASYTDFRLLVTYVRGLGNGVWINIGSAVLLPEAFVKAVNLAHNLGDDLDGLVTANLDMLRHYRTRVNVLRRPAQKGIEIIGHHEINVPLLRVGVLAELSALAEES